MAMNDDEAIASMHEIAALRRDLEALRAAKDAADRAHFVTMAALVHAAGGKIEVDLKAALAVPCLTLQVHSDPRTGNEVYQTVRN